MASPSKSAEVVPPHPVEVPLPQLTGVGEEKEREKAPVQESSGHEHPSSSEGATDNSGAADTAEGPMPQLRMAGWSKSNVKEEDIDQLEKEGVILPRVMVACHAACGESFPTPNTHKTVVFVDFLKCGLSFPLSLFFIQVLEFYGVELVNLNPNSILFLSVFAHLCEAYLRTRPR